MLFAITILLPWLFFAPIVSTMALGEYVAAQTKAKVAAKREQKDGERRAVALERSFEKAKEKERISKAIQQWAHSNLPRRDAVVEVVYDRQVYSGHPFHLAVLKGKDNGGNVNSSKFVFGVNDAGELTGGHALGAWLEQ